MSFWANDILWFLRGVEICLLLYHATTSFRKNILTKGPSKGRDCCVRVLKTNTYKFYILKFLCQSFILMIWSPKVWLKYRTFTSCQLSKKAVLTRLQLSVLQNLITSNKNHYHSFNWIQAPCWPIRVPYIAIYFAIKTNLWRLPI